MASPARVSCLSSHTHHGRAAIAAAAVALGACTLGGPPSPQPLVVDDAALADETRSDWLTYGRTYGEQRFSPLAQIHDGNVGELRPDWVLQLPGDRGLVSTPLVVDGVLYFIGSMNVVRAVDATSGELLWRYDPRVGERADRLRAGWDHSRGIAYWRGRVYVATWDGRLNAVDARTGREIWSVTTIDPDVAMYITGAPKVFKGKVLIGNGGTEHGPSRGYVTAYDAETGEQAWRFWIVPGNPADGFENEAMRMAAETWTGAWWLHGGGGNAWHGFTYDPELDQLYIGTGNGSPWNRKIRSPDGGDNLFLSSIVALDPDTGEYLWHYQTAPGETWDFNSNMDIVLTDLEIEGRVRRVILHAPKNGFFYVIDRTNGALISAEPFVETTWATHVDPESGRPVEVAGARYESGPAIVSPTPLGAHTWHAMSFNPRTGLAYYPAIHLSMRWSDAGIDLDSWRSTNWIGGTGVSWTIAGTTGPGGAASTLQAWDPVRQELAWEVPLPGIYSPGTLTTAGNLVFQGRLDGTFVAYAADTGEALWSTDLGLGVSAPPITYSVGGRQYVALLVGWGGAMAGLGGGASADYGWAYGVHTRMLVAFSLEGTATLPVQPPPYVPEPIAADFVVDVTLAAQGGAVFGLCGNCHGPGAVSAGMAPDLRASSTVLDAGLFRRIVQGGARSGQGMPRYEELSDQMLEALRHYIRQRAQAAIRPSAEE
jgi:quinohemoprotein ethanol dehydrogenase